MSIAAGAIGAIAGVAGLYLLWRSWAERKRAHGLALGLGWALLLTGTVIWAFAGGDAGVAIGVSGLTALASLALAGIAYSVYVTRAARPARAAGQRAMRDETKLSAALIARRVMTFLFAGPVGGAVTIVLTLSFLKALQSSGVNEADRIVYALLFAPLIWAGLAVYVVMDSLLKRKAALLIGAGALCALHLAFLA